MASDFDKRNGRSTSGAPEGSSAAAAPGKQTLVERSYGSVGARSSGGSGGGYYAPPPGQARPPKTLSRIGEAVQNTLQSTRGAQQGTNWNVSYGNELSNDWLLASPRPDGADFLYKEVYTAIVTAQHTLTLSTLSSPDEPYLDTINRAVLELANREIARHGSGVDMRILIGMAEDPKGPEAVLQRILGRVTKGLPPDGPIRVSVATGGSMQSWNHSKILATDGQQAIVGGHNWWSESYNRPDPVRDVSMRVRGPAASQAEDYFDGMWSYASSHGTVVGNAQSRRAPADEQRAARAHLQGRGSPIIAVGTQGGISINADATADTAIYAMIDAARTNLKLSQQALNSNEIAGRDKSQSRFAWHNIKAAVAEQVAPKHINTTLLDKLCEALLRGVSVEIMISGSDANAGYTNGWSASDTRTAILGHLHQVAQRRRHANVDFPFRRPRQEQATTPHEVDEAEAAQHLDIRHTHGPDGKGTPNHAKVVIVDDAAFYIGSQNLYPGGMAESTFVQLGEFGYIVDDKEKTDEVLQGYWTDEWGRAK